MGGIAKGYALDEAARILRKSRVQNFHLDAGGDVYVGGKNCDQQLWRIGIRDPKSRDKIIDVVHVTDRAVATSGNYEQYYKVANQKWSHIINTVTGFPQKEVVSSTVIAKSATDADALATAISVLGKSSGIKIIDGLKDDYATL